MQPQLFRIDDRLIHGQVVLGWAKPLKSECILLCDNDVAHNDWEKELYLSCVSGHLKSIVMDVNDTCDYMNQNNKNLGKTIIVVKSPGIVLELINCGFKPEVINIGGLHFSDERKQYLPYVFLNQNDIVDCNSLLSQNIEIYCQDVPTAKKYLFEDIIL